MSKLSWVIAFWLFGIALGQPTFGQSAVKNVALARTGTAATQTASAIDAPPIVPLGVQRDIHSIAEALNAANQKAPSSTDERNAIAQEKVAYLTPQMIWVAKVETTITFIGVILVALTLIATWQAKNQAKRAADAAQASLDHMRFSTQQELRAYLSVEPLGITALDDWETALGHVNVINVGKVPAKNVSVRVKLARASTKDIELVFDDDTENGRGVIQPGASIRQGSRNYFPARDTQGDGERYVYIYGIAYYGDGFGTRKFTQFCHRYDVTSFDRGWRRSDNENRMIIRPEKARYHKDGNEAN